MRFTHFPPTPDCYIVIYIAFRLPFRPFFYATTEKDPDVKDFDLSGIYSSKADWGAQFRAPSTLQTFDENGRNGNPNGLTRKQEMMVRSAIKYWVERHKHVVR